MTMKERQKIGSRQWHYLAIMTLCIVYALGAGGAVSKPSTKRTSLSEAELRTLATSVPDVKNAGALYSVAMATSNNVEVKQEYLKAAAACLVASGREDVYRKRVKSRLSNAEEVEGELNGDCSRCAGTGAKERRCSVCQGKGTCPTCKGSGQVVSVGFDGQNGSRSCRKCSGSGHCSKCDGGGSTKEKCTACAGSGKLFSKTVAACVFRDTCNALADRVGTVVSQSDVTVNQGDKVNSEARISKSEENADSLASVREAEKLFAKRCEAAGGEVSVRYDDVQYSIFKNTDDEDNFVIARHTPDSRDLAVAFLIFPTSDLRDKWYDAVVECVDKIKSWIRVAAKNKVKYIRKQIPIGARGVCAYSNGITRGRGMQELYWKDVRETISPYSCLNLPSIKFIGSINAFDKFTNYRVSIEMECGDLFKGAIFHESGTLEEIEKKTVEFLTFVNPKSFENVRKKQTEKEALFK